MPWPRESKTFGTTKHVEAQIKSPLFGGDPLGCTPGRKPIGGATFTIGAEGTNAITVNIQLTDYNGDDISYVGCVHAFLSDAATGIGISSTGPDTSVAAGTDGAVIIIETAVLAFLLQSEADGDIDLVLTETSTATWYLVIVLPDGSQAVSGAITFA
jgi:hypothetical protein